MNSLNLNNWSKLSSLSFSLSWNRKRVSRPMRTWTWYYIFKVWIWPSDFTRMVSSWTHQNTTFASIFFNLKILKEKLFKDSIDFVAKKKKWNLVKYPMSKLLKLDAWPIPISCGYSNNFTLWLYKVFGPC